MVLLRQLSILPWTGNLRYFGGNYEPGVDGREKCMVRNFIIYSIHLIPYFLDFKTLFFSHILKFLKLACVLYLMASKNRYTALFLKTYYEISRWRLWTEVIWRIIKMATLSLNACDVAGKAILRWIVKSWEWEGVEWIHLALGRDQRSCEISKGTFIIGKGVKFRKQLLMRDSPSWS